MRKRIISFIISAIITLELFMPMGGMNEVYAASEKLERALQWAIAIANDNSHGYSQSNRWGNPDYDCSSFVVSALRAAGYDVGGATYTQNMRSALTSRGFTWIPWEQIGSVSNLRRGDILLNDSSNTSKQHTEFYLGNNQNVGAHQNYGYPASGDQTGKEISVAGYYNHPWTGVLRENSLPSQPVLAPTQIRAWISDSKMGNVPETFKYGGTYYLCYELLDETTGKCYEAPNGVSYQMKETIYAPDGSVVNTCTYGNNNNWISIQPGQSGRYRGVIEISGAYTGKCEVEFDIPQVSILQLGTRLAKSPMGDKTESYKQGNYCYICYELVDKESRKRWGELCAGNYNIEIIVYKPNGSVLGSDTFHGDNGYFGCQVQDEGTYKWTIKVSGTYIDGVKQFTDSFEVLPQTEIGFYYGDLDLDKKITVTDMSVMNQAANGKITLSDDEKKRADLDGDGKITKKDVELLQQFYVGQISEFPIEKMLTHIIVMRSPDKTSYYVGDALSMAGMKVEAIYGDFTIKEIKGYKISGNTNKAGTQNVTISYTEGGITKTAIQKIDVKEKHVHSYTSRITQEATCTTAGIRTYTCTCGVSYTEGIAKKQHTAVADKAQAATCTTAGKTEGSHCTVCGAVLKVQTTIPATGHAWDTGKVTKQPTATASGVRTYTCSVCKITKAEMIPATGTQGHTHNYTGKITKAATCSSEGEKTYTCACGNSYTEQIAKKQHTAVADKAQAATCTQAGKTEGSHCAVCGTVLKVQTTIPATGHAWDMGKVTKQPTATASGVRTYTCSVCKVTKTEMIPATGNQGHTHSYAEKVTKAATCSSEGEKTYTCSCGNSYTERIAQKQHTAVPDKAQAATCRQIGKTEGSHCAVCGMVLKAQTVIPMTDHCWNDGIVIKPATEYWTGVKSYTCQLCGRTRQEILPVAGTQDFGGNNSNKTKVGDIVVDKARSARYQVIRLKAGEIEVQYAGTLNGKVSSVKIPDKIETPDGTKCTVTAISKGAFQNNKYLKKVVIGNNVRTIGQEVFYGCNGLTSLQLGKNVTYINANAFRKCNSLKKLVLPASVSNIGSNAFYGCKNLKILQIKSTKLSSASLDKKTFAGVSSKTSVKVPKSKLKTYRKLFRKKGINKKIKIY